MKFDRVFYVNPKNVKEGKFILDNSESIHAIRVIRSKNGDGITLIDGLGMGYLAVITGIKHDIVSGEIEKFLPLLGESKYHLKIAPSIIKMSRFEFMLEKATEMGVKTIYPIVTERSFKKKINLHRLKKIIKSSTKQSRRSFLPTLEQPSDLKSFLCNIKGKCVAGLQKSQKTLSDLNLLASEPVIILTGPEGDFSEVEVNNMKNAGVEFYSLGERRLRSETAMLASLAVASHQLSGRWK